MTFCDPTLFWPVLGDFLGRDPKFAQNGPKQRQIKKVHKTDPHFFDWFMGGHVYSIFRFDTILNCFERVLDHAPKFFSEKQL